jgi:hypothetical protein
MTSWASRLRETILRSLSHLWAINSWEMIGHWLLFTIAMYSSSVGHCSESRQSSSRPCPRWSDRSSSDRSRYIIKFNSTCGVQVYLLLFYPNQRAQLPFEMVHRQPELAHRPGEQTVADRQGSMHNWLSLWSGVFHRSCVRLGEIFSQFVIFGSFNGKPGTPRRSWASSSMSSILREHMRHEQILMSKHTID